MVTNQKGNILSDARPLTGHQGGQKSLLLGPQEAVLSSWQLDTPTPLTESYVGLPADPGSLTAQPPTWLRQPGCSGSGPPSCHLPRSAAGWHGLLTHLPVYILPNEKQLCLWKRAILVRCLLFSPSSLAGRMAAALLRG